MSAQLLSPEHEQAIADPAVRLRILACAGAGKTEVLARRAVRLLGEGVEPRAIVAFTFTDKAALELKSRIERRAAEADPRYRELPPVGRGMFIGTTHSWALAALRDLGGAYETYDGMTAEQEWALLNRVARRLGVVDLYAQLEDKPSDKVAAAPAIGVFLRTVEVVHNERIDRSTLQAAAPAFAQVLERYEWLLEEMRLLPFRLMIGKAVDELAPGGRLHAQLAGRLEHLLIDECQDFNTAQDQLLSHLAELGATVTVVGDDDQAVYQWRGGNLELFSRFHDRYQGTKTVPLSANRRSRPEIINFAKPLVLELAGRADKELETAREQSEAGAVEVLVAETPQQEAEAIAARTRQLVDAGHAPGEIAVLYRSVRTSARPLIDELRQRRLPVAVIGKTSMLARPEMALVAHIFIYWASGTWYPNPEFESESVTRASLRREIRAVTGAGSFEADLILEELDTVGAIVAADGVNDSVVLFNKILTVLRLPAESDSVDYQELGLGRMSQLLTDFDHTSRRAIPAVFYEDVSADKQDEADEDETLAADRESEQRTVLGARRGDIYLMRLRAYLEEFAGRAAEETPDSSPEAANAVQVMTVHQAKGLEYAIVFVPSLVEGRFPSSLLSRSQTWYLPDSLFDRHRYEGREDDEARLLYVALTRAKELLVVSWFQRYSKRRARPSRFITDGLRNALNDALAYGQTRPARLNGHVGDELLDLDFSSLVTFIECGHRYWLRHVCGFQPPLVPELGFGKLLHHLVAELARRGRDGHPATAEQVDELLDDSFYLPFAGTVPKAKLHKAARRRLGGYVRGHGDELTRTIKPEVGFEVPLANARIRGRIDLVLRARGDQPNQVELIDFKTSENRPPSEFHVDQLRMYAAAAERIGWEPVSLAIHDLDADKGGRILIDHDDTKRREFSDRLEGWVEQIRVSSFDPTDNEGTCRGCDFRSFCRHTPPGARHDPRLTTYQRS